MTPIEQLRALVKAMKSAPSNSRWSLVRLVGHTQFQFDIPPIDFAAILAEMERLMAGQPETMDFPRLDSPVKYTYGGNLPSDSHA